MVHLLLYNIKQLIGIRIQILYYCYFHKQVSNRLFDLYEQDRLVHHYKSMNRISFDNVEYLKEITLAIV